jgi:uncharacterized RDD family membrane protein YckC
MSTSQPPPGFSDPAPSTATEPAAQPQQPYGEPVATARGASGPRAGFWRRFAAALIDGIIVGVVVIVLELILRSAGYGIGLIISAGYYTYFEGGPQGAGPGKRAMGIRVIDFDTGGPIGYGRGFIRWIGRFVSEIVILIGYFWMIWDKEKQTWHDKFANDVVVPASAYPAPAS